MIGIPLCAIPLPLRGGINFFKLTNLPTKENTFDSFLMDSFIDQSILEYYHFNLEAYAIRRPFHNPHQNTADDCVEDKNYGPSYQECKRDINYAVLLAARNVILIVRLFDVCVL